MKAHVIYGGNYRESSDKLNKYIAGKRIVDIKFAVNYVEDEAHYSFLVLYEE
ncbi:hypothetical protein JW868_04400 [Candidatus Woesearchaeota archaeon]|nr:hypothetical protein [Candidatus Woesearchaeota archaeon]